MEQLPDELLLSIFSLFSSSLEQADPQLQIQSLYHLLAVSRRWYRLVPQSWSCISFPTFLDPSPLALNTLLQDRTLRLKTASFSQLSSANLSTAIGSLAKSHSHLHIQRLSMASQKSLGPQEMDLISTFASLRSLNLSQLNVHPEPFEHIISQCPNLEEIDLSYTVSTDFPRLLHALTTAPRLTRLSLNHCTGLNSARSLLDLVRGCRQLVHLDLGCCTGVVDDYLLGRLAETCGAQLQSLEVESCYRITDDGVAQFVRQCPELTELSLWNCKSVGRRMIDALSACCPRLESLDLHCCTEIDSTCLQVLSAGCPHLRALDLCACKRVDDTGIHALADCPGLERLVLHGTSLTGRGLMALSQCARLKALDISQCTALQLRSLVLFLESPAAGSLEYLNLTGLSRIEHADALLVLLSVHSPHLTDLRIASLPVSLHGVKQLAKGCPHLTRIDMSNCFPDTHPDPLVNFIFPELSHLVLWTNDCLTDTGVESLVASCSKIAKLSLSECKGITWRSLYAVSSGLKRLEELEVAHCQGLTTRRKDGRVSAMLLQCRALRRLVLPDGILLQTKESIQKHLEASQACCIQ